MKYSSAPTVWAFKPLPKMNTVMFSSFEEVLSSKNHSRKHCFLYPEYYQQTGELQSSCPRPHACPRIFSIHRGRCQGKIGAYPAQPCYRYSMFSFWDNSCSKQRRISDERPRTNVFEPRSMRGRQGNLVTKTSNPILSSASRTPKTRTNRRTSGS